MAWEPATVVTIRDETASAKTFRLRLSRPRAHLAGQHYIVRLSAPDGYSVARHLGPARRRHAGPGRVVLALSPPVLGLSVPVLMVSWSGR